MRLPFSHIKHDFPTLLQETAKAGTRNYVTPQGERYPSVTTVLKQHSEKGIAKWRAKVGEKKANHISRTATVRGTAVHDALEKYIKNEHEAGVGLLPNEKVPYVHMKKVVDEHIDNIHCLETMMFSHELKLAGQVDMIAEYDGKLTVVDFKTSRKLKKEKWIENYFMQLAAYSVMFTEHTKLEIQQGIIIIGVDNVNYAQVITVNPYDYLEPLKDYITKYANRLAA
jgi:ATP-dependent exoDNAse (exonuclease V) beta subunit